MPVYEVTAPNGKTYEVTAPDGATEQDAIARVQRDLGAAPPEAPAATPTDGETTAGGVAAAAGRGAAPYAAGAGVGAAIGSVVPGVGTVAGAAAGAGAVGITDLATSIYNRFAGKQVMTPRDLTDMGMDAAGVRRPASGVERTVESATGGVASALSGAGAAKGMADAVTGPLGKRVAETLAASPGKQAAAGAAGGAAGQGATEAGADPLTATGVSLAASAAPYGGAMAKRMAYAPPKDAALRARDAGYVITPAMASDDASVLSSGLAGWAGKIKTQQLASAKNQEITNGLAAKALDLPPKTELTEDVLRDVRQKAGKAYQAVADAPPPIHVDQDYRDAIQGLGSRGGQASIFFPDVVNNQEIEKLRSSMVAFAQFPPRAGIEVAKDLRYNAVQNLKARQDPERLALGIAQREAADAVEGLIERNLQAQGNTKLMQDYREARQMIARSYDVEAAMNPATGDVSARTLAALSRRGRPLTGELETIADSAMAFPKAFQNTATFGGHENTSILDMLAGGAAIAQGHPGLGAGVIVGRPLARGAVTSQPYQRAMTRQQPIDYAGPGLRALGANSLPTGEDDSAR